jgi:hypothetical protein
MENEENQEIEPEVIQEETSLVKPSIPVTVDQLAALEDEAGLLVVERRHKIVDTLRRASISLTNPQDWLLFRADNRVTAFLQDSGCQRIMPLWGIEITPKGGFVETRVNDDPAGDYAITCYADAYCNVTNQMMKDIEGTRYSDEDFVNGYHPLPPIKKKIRIQQAAVANRNGNAVRKLTGLSNVAIELIQEVWKGSGKSIDLCAHGKGFGSKQERAGAQVQEAAHVPAGKEPKCETCGAVMKFWPAGISKTSNKPYPAFWSCSSKDHKYSIKDEEYQKILAINSTAERQPGEDG